MKILIIDDEEELRVALKQALEQECFAVDTAEDGEKGSYLARTNNYNVIILDNILPGKTGPEVCADIRKDGITTPVIIVSVKSETTTKVELLNAGADDYMIKPFDFEELLARIRALLRRPKSIAGNIINSRGILLDTKKHIVKRGEKELKLTRKEFMLLQYLMSNQGTTLSRGMIMEHVWDMSIDPFSNTIEAHIMSLRRKLGSKSKFIHTVSGRGYKFE